MRRAIVLCAALIGSALFAADVSAANASAERLAHLVRQLGSARFAEREAATRSLDALGDAAVPALQTAMASNDPETRRRAGELLERIGQRATVAKILKPTTISLNFEGTPVADAVRILGNLTGLHIELQQVATNSNRKISLKCGPLPIWEAVEQFCRSADLHEWDGFSPLAGHSAPPPTANPQGNIVFGGGVPAQIVVNGRVARSSFRGDNRVVLCDGPGPAPASHHAGAVRLRALPVGTPFPMSVMGDEVLLPLQASAEPRLQWGGILSVRVDKAIDELGNVHAASGVIAPIGNSSEVIVVPMMNGGMMAQQAPGRLGLGALKIARGDKAGKSIRELTGELTAQVHITEPLARIEGPLKSGSSASGADGISVKLLDVSEPSPGELKLSVELALPIDVQPIGGLPGFGGRVAFQGGVVFQQQNRIAAAPALPQGTTEFCGLTLEDAKGRRWTAINGYQESMRIGPQGQSSQLNLTFKAPDADVTAARLVFSGSRPTVIAIPFTFRDLALP